MGRERKGDGEGDERGVGREMKGGWEGEGRGEKRRLGVKERREYREGV